MMETGDRLQAPPAAERRPATPSAAAPNSDAPDAVARIARAHLAQAADAQRRLRDGDDDEALHDFRVSLRRLRAHLRAHGRYTRLGDEHRAQLERLADATGRARDLQVQIGWLERIAAGDGFDHASTAARAAARTLAARLRDELDTAHAAARDTLARDFPAVRTELAECLRRGGPTIRPALTFSAASADVAIAAARKLRRNIRSVERPRDQEPAHAARIAAKRLRYLLEPFTAASPRAARLVERLRRLQELLGDMHDVHLLRAHVRATDNDGDDMRELARILKRERRRLLRRVRKRARTAGGIVRRTRRAFEELRPDRELPPRNAAPPSMQRRRARHPG